MRVLSFEVGPFLARCVVVADPVSAQAVVVDPGFDVEVPLAAIADEGLQVTEIVLTHAHLDHAAGVAEVRRAWPDIPFRLHVDDLPVYHNVPMQARMFGLPPPEVVSPSDTLADGDVVRVGSHELRVRHCPGHSPGHVVFLGRSGAAPMAMVGDVLFAGSIGRTDLWGGSFEVLERSIREVLYPLSDDTRVIPGHGPETTIGVEKRHNPFVPG